MACTPMASRAFNKLEILEYVLRYYSTIFIACLFYNTHQYIISKSCVYFVISNDAAVVDSTSMH